jgi:hypothetical protein
MTRSTFKFIVAAMLLLSASASFYPSTSLGIGAREERVLHEATGRMTHEIREKSVEFMLRTYKLKGSSGNKGVDEMLGRFSREERADFEAATGNDRAAKEALKRLTAKSEDVFTKERLIETRREQDTHIIDTSGLQRLVEETRKAAVGESAEPVRKALAEVDGRSRVARENFDASMRLALKMDGLNAKIAGGPNASAANESAGLREFGREIGDWVSQGLVTKNNADRLGRTLDALSEASGKLPPQQAKELAEAAALRIEDAVVRGASPDAVAERLQSVETELQSPNALQVEVGYSETHRAGLKKFRELLIAEAEKLGHKDAKDMSTMELKKLLEREKLTEFEPFLAKALEESDAADIYNLMDKNQEAAKTLVVKGKKPNGQGCNPRLGKFCAGGKCAAVAAKFAKERGLQAAAAASLIAFWTQVDKEAAAAYPTDKGGSSGKATSPDTHGGASSSDAPRSRTAPKKK